jgi:hypothetical protein
MDTRTYAHTLSISSALFTLVISSSCHCYHFYTQSHRCLLDLTTLPHVSCQSMLPRFYRNLCNRCIAYYSGCLNISCNKYCRLTGLHSLIRNTTVFIWSLSCQWYRETWLSRANTVTVALTYGIGDCSIVRTTSIQRDVNDRGAIYHHQRDMVDCSVISDDSECFGISVTVVVSVNIRIILNGSLKFSLSILAISRPDKKMRV